MSLLNAAALHAGQAALAAGDTWGAAACYEQALQADPSDAEAYFALACVSLELKRADAGAALFAAAAELRPDWPEAWYNLGCVALELQRRDEAVAAFTRATELRPDWAPAWNNLGLALGVTPAAVAAFERLVELQPDSADAHHAVGAVWLLLGEDARLIEPYRRALALRPDWEAVRNALAAAEARLAAKTQPQTQA